MEFDDTKAKTIAFRGYPSPSFKIAHSNFIKTSVTVTDFCNFVAIHSEAELRFRLELSKEDNAY